MKEIKTEIIIPANIQMVWDKLSDFASYPTWNHFITCQHLFYWPT